MLLWLSWWNLVLGLRRAFTRYRTFLWFAAALAAFSVRGDLSLSTTTILHGQRQLKVTSAAG